MKGPVSAMCQQDQPTIHDWLRLGLFFLTFVFLVWSIPYTKVFMVAVALAAMQLPGLFRQAVHSGRRTMVDGLSGQISSCIALAGGKSRGWRWEGYFMTYGSPTTLYGKPVVASGHLTLYYGRKAKALSRG